jgi:hypothetical protein
VRIGAPAVIVVSDPEEPDWGERFDGSKFLVEAILKDC